MTKTAKYIYDTLKEENLNLEEEGLKGLAEKLADGVVKQFWFNPQIESRPLTVEDIEAAHNKLWRPM
jgi:hypothetical protein